MRALTILALTLCMSLSALAAQHTPMLIDQRGQRFALGESATPTVVTFIAAHCKDTCPLITAQFATIQQQIVRLHLPLRLVSITLDPEHDSLTDLRNMARTFSANPRYWTVAGGSVADVHKLMRQYNVTSQRGADGYADIHTTFVYLLDRHGRLYKSMLASTQMPEDLFSEMQRDWRALNS